MEPSLHIAIPASPPPEALDALDTAQAVLQKLAAKRVELRLAVDEPLEGVRVLVAELGGRVIREISAVRALDLLAGGQMDELTAAVV